MTSSTQAIGYRPEIDGLRAIAVLAVVFYHAGLGCPGGYVGVDVFFVISGYLITSLILKDLRQGTFSLTTFWERQFILSCAIRLPIPFPWQTGQIIKNKVAMMNSGRPC